MLEEACGGFVDLEGHNKGNDVEVKRSPGVNGSKGSVQRGGRHRSEGGVLPTDVYASWNSL